MSPVTESETLAIPLENLEQAEVRIAFGGGELAIGRAAAGTLVSGTFEGGVVQRQKGPGAVALEPADPARWLVAGRPRRWDVGLTAEIPVDLRLETGANRSTIDLTALRLRRLELHTGASDTVIRLPASGHLEARVECGFASVAMELPPGVAGRIQSQMALGSTDVDETRFPRVAHGWASPDFESAPNRVDIVIAGGFGSVQVR
jgi:hypothetical protein